MFLEQKRLNLRAWRCADSRSGKPYRCVSPGVRLETTGPSIVKKETAVPFGGFRGVWSCCGAVSFFKETASPVWFKMMKFGSVILAGGRSLRMGEDKAKLKIDGMCFLDRIAEELCGFDELLVSVDELARHPVLPYPTVCDRFPGCGPMAGLHAALSVCASEALFVVSCDLPLFRGELAVYLCERLTQEVDAVVPLTSDGRIHPLCAVYRKEAAALFEQFLMAGNLRIRDVLRSLRVEYVPISDSPCSESWLLNVNTKEEYQALCERKV